MGQKNHAILLIHCTDRKGLISTITHFLFEHNGNIIDLDEHVEKIEGIFFMRVKWELEAFDIPKDQIREAFAAPFHGQKATHGHLRIQSFSLLV